MPIFKYLTIILLLFPMRVFGQDSLHNKKVKLLPVPALGYSPETRTYVGVVTLFTFKLYQDSLTRTSNAKLEFNYTWNKQVIFECGWNYFFKEEKWFTKGLLHFSKYPDLYYGIGALTPDTNKLVYNSRRIVLEASCLRKIKKSIFTGLNFKYIDYSKINADSNKNRYPELVNGSTIGVGYSILKDSRNNLLNPTNGNYVYGNISYNMSQNPYYELMLDCRLYKTFSKQITVAGRFVNDLNLGKTPFYDLAYLGGDKFVRGYYYGRFRDNNLSALQTEVRFPVVWRLGLAAFGGLANIYSNTNPFKFNNIKYNYGAGIRFMVDKKDKTNLRLDYAMGSNGNSGFYIAFGESF